MVGKLSWHVAKSCVCKNGQFELEVNFNFSSLASLLFQILPPANAVYTFPIGRTGHDHWSCHSLATICSIKNKQKTSKTIPKKSVKFPFQLLPPATAVYTFLGKNWSRVRNRNLVLSQFGNYLFHPKQNKSHTKFQKTVEKFPNKQKIKKKLRENILWLGFLKAPLNIRWERIIVTSIITNIMFKVGEEQDLAKQPNSLCSLHNLTVSSTNWTT